MKLLVIAFCLSAFTAQAVAPIRAFRFVEAKKIKEGSNLPPKLILTFEIKCNEELVKVLRYDWTEPKSHKVSIAVGALFKENLLSSCAGKKVEVEADAGHTFSGREFEITRIKIK